MSKSNDDTHCADSRNSPIASVQPTNTQVILYPTRNNVLTTYTNPKIICKSMKETEISKIARVPLLQLFICRKDSCKRVAIGQCIGWLWCPTVQRWSAQGLETLSILADWYHVVHLISCCPRSSPIVPDHRVVLPWSPAPCRHSDGSRMLINQ
jgi:hypothetical protein